MDKKGVEMPLNVIIIATIALLVLVILSVIFMGRMGIFTKESGGTNYCQQTLGGKCSYLEDEFKNKICQRGETKVGVCDDGSFCCKKV